MDTRKVTMLAALVGVALVDLLPGCQAMRRKPDKSKEALPACGVKGASGPSGQILTQIVNGQDATECEWPWQAQLRTSSAFCGGTLISPEWVLTAGYCVSNMSDTNFEVRVGDFDTSKNSANQQTRAAAEVYLHPEYKAGWSSEGAGRGAPENDFALVKISSPVTINDCVGTACLPAAGEDVTANQRCWITGWGALGTDGSTPKILQEAAVNIVSNDDCVNKIGVYDKGQITDAMICAQGRNADGSISSDCQGDNGGPLVCESNGKWTVYGATSWQWQNNGRPWCTAERYPGIWARVHQVLDWIEDFIPGIVPAPAPPTPPVPTPTPTTPAPTPPVPGCELGNAWGPDRSGDCTCNYGSSCYEDGNPDCTNSRFFKSNYKFLLSCGACKCS